jgi:hypothetical protein
MKGHYARLVVAALAAALVLAACGGKGTTTTKSPSKPADNGVAAKDANQILSDAKTALRGASSVHLTGAFADSGNRFGLDMRVGRGAATGSFTVQGSQLNVLAVDGKFYLRGKLFWQKTGGAQLANAIGDRWVLVPPSSTAAASFADFKKLTELDAYADEFLKPTGTISKGQTGSVNGQPAVALKDSDGSSLWVATSGSPLPLRIEPKDTGTGDKLDFVDYNAPVSATAPADALDISKFQTG